MEHEKLSDEEIQLIPALVAILRVRLSIPFHTRTRLQI